VAGADLKASAKPTAKTTGKKGAAAAKPAEPNPAQRLLKTLPKRPPPKPAPPPKPTKAPKLDLAQVKERLETERAELQSRIEELEQEADGPQFEMTGEAGIMGEDFADAGTATFDRERDLSIRNNIKDLIDQVERALESLKAGTYGVCERCGRYIEGARLKALPHALMCLDCKRREERIR
jgi:DnaK suppressor protein